MASFPVRLVCPRCRGPLPGSGIRVEFLDEEDRCSGCGEEYSRIEGIRRVLPRPLDEWPPGEDPEWPERVIPVPEDPGSRDFREAKLAAIHAVTHFPRVTPLPSWLDLVSENAGSSKKLSGWLDRHPPPEHATARCALDAGCGPGGMLGDLSGRLPGGAVGLDVRLSMLRLAHRFVRGGSVTLPFCTEGHRFEPLVVAPAGAAPGAVSLVQGDILDPPFEAGAFALVCAFSLLDTVSDPIHALGQLDALLAPGGLLLLAQPWHWVPDVTEVARWWSGTGSSAPAALRSLLSGASALLPHLSFELLEEGEGIPWTLPGHDRLVHRYFLHAILARKRA